MLRDELSVVDAEIPTSPRGQEHRKPRRLRPKGGVMSHQYEDRFRELQTRSQSDPSSMTPGDWSEWELLSTQKTIDDVALFYRNKLDRQKTTFLVAQVVVLIIVTLPGC